MPEKLSGYDRMQISNQKGESHRTWWERAHTEDDLEYVSGYGGPEIWQRLDVTERVKPGAVVLNIGVGQGTCTRDLAAKGCIVHALDIAPAALARVADVAKGYLADNLDSLPSNTFDLAVSHLVAQHMPNEALEAQMRAMMRALKPGGVFALQFLSPSEKGIPEFNESYAKTGGVVRPPEMMIDMAQRAGGQVIKCVPNDFTEYWAWHIIQIMRPL